MSEDLLGLALDASEEEQPAAFTVGQPARSNAEMIVLEEMHRHGSAAFPGATEPLFTTEDQDGIETFDAGQAIKWQALMRWPVLPTLAEVLGFKAHQAAALRAAYHPKFREVQRLQQKPG